MKSNSKFRTQFEPRKVYKSFKGVKSLTDQQYKEECSIVGIIKKFGVLPTPTVEPKYGDVSELGDFATNLERVETAKAEFMALPSQIRERFGNDPRAFFDFVSNGDNIDEMIKLGLAEKRVERKSTEELLNDINENIKKGVTSSEGGQT